jgi:predicted GNAT superfamily acetyltransferase
MDLQIRNVAAQELPLVLALNEQAIPLVNHLEIETLHWFARTAAYFRVAEIGGRVAAFLIAITPDADYDSQYFGWFCQRYTDFLYVDRVVVADWAQRRGVGLALYRDLEQFAFETGCTLAADVYSDPPNEISLAFHAKFGFAQVGAQFVEADGKEVAKFLKPPPVQ